MKNALELKDAPARTEQLLADIQKMLNAENIFTNDVQQQMLTSHVKAMVLRSITGEPLPEVDKDLFDEISPGSMKMAEEVVERPICSRFILKWQKTTTMNKDNNN
jgi:PRD domain protein (TIGR03582 family)